MSRLLAALGAVTLLACGSSGGRVGLQLTRPAAVAVFQGVTTKVPGQVHPYVAIADAPDGELVLVDAVDDLPVEAPIDVWPLSVPVPGSPALLAAGSLSDVDAEERPLADLLVVAIEGSTRLAVIDTWSGTPAVAFELDLAELAPGAALLSLATAAVPGASDGEGAFVAVPGRVRLLCGLTGGRLAVYELERAGAAVALAGQAVQELGFDAVAIAAAVRPGFVYAATRDPIPPTDVLGVARLDTTGAPGAFAVAAIPTRAATRLVATARLRELNPGETEFDTDPLSEVPALYPMVDRVYAVLDERTCGRLAEIPCGVAVLDPAALALRADPVGELPYLAPISVPGMPLALAVSRPPVNPPSTVDVLAQDDFMMIAPGSGQRLTSGVLSVASTDGVVYMVDLARWQVANNQSLLRSTSRTRATSSFGLGGGEQVFPIPGVWQEVDLDRVPLETPKVVVDLAGVQAAVRLTPGYTIDAVWTVAYQGPLPGLAGRRAASGAEGGGVWVAVQTPVVGGTFTEVAHVHGPELGVREGDVVVIAADATATGCPATGLETTVAEVLAPEARFPGGALLLAPPATPAEACLAALAAGRTDLQVTVRAAGFVLSSDALGYAGRPQLLAAHDAGEPYALRYQPDEAFACPLVAGAPAPCADEACRLACEGLVLARKARRVYNVGDACRDPVTDSQCLRFWPRAEFPFPLATGPVVAFKLGLVPDPSGAETPPVARGAFFTFATQNGISPASRRPPGVGTAVLPTSLAVFDRSAYAGKEGEGYRVYAAYTGGFVLDFSHALAPSTPVVVR